MRPYFIILVVLSLNILSEAQWTRTSGPGSGTINSLTYLNETLVAGTNHGIYLSSDQGNNWNFSGLNSFKFTSLSAKSNFIFAGSNNGKIFRSADIGVTWIELNADFPPVEVSSIISVNNYLLASFYDDWGEGRGGIYRSSDNGDNWLRLNFPTSGGYRVFDLTVHNNFVVAAGWDGLYKSVDGGDSWGKLSGLQEQISSIGSSGVSLFAGNFYSLFRSTDNGNSWVELDFLLEYPDINVFTSTDNFLFVGTGSGIFKSSDNGEIWIEVKTGLSDHEVWSLISFNNNLFAGTNNGGMHFSSNDGNDWEVINLGLNNSYIHSITVVGDKIFSGTSGGVYYSTDNGNNWNYSGLAIDVKSILNKNNVLFAATLGEGVYKSTDFGITWEQINNGLPDYVSANAIISKDDNIYVGTGEGIYISSDEGFNWTSSNNGLEGLDRFVNTLASSSNKLYAGTGIYILNSDMGSVYISNNNGLNWELTSLSGEFNFRSIATENNFVWAGNNGIFTNGLFLSTDFGSTWNEINNEFIGVQTILINNDKVILGTENGVYFSSDNGSNWSSLNEGFPEDISVTLLTVNDYYLLAGTYGYGLWRLPLSVLTVDDPKIPDQYFIYQNYPNPFNPSTQISFSIPQNEFVNLSVYNIIGEKVAELVNGTLTAGKYDIKFDAGKLTSGIYIARIKTGNFDKLIKMTLMK